MSAQGISVSRFTQFSLPDCTVRLISQYLTEAGRIKIAAVCKRWQGHAILLEERKKTIPRLDLSANIQSTRPGTFHPIIFLFGRPGSGKGTLAQALVKTRFFSHLSLGDYFRRLIAEGDPIGKRFEKDILNHKPIPLELIHQVIEKQLEAVVQHGIIFDGFPRDPKSIEFIDRLVRAKYQEHPIIAVYIKIDRKVAEERIASRGICEKCDLIFNLKMQDSCFNCKVKLKPRLDAGAQGRQDGFEEKFAASLSHYKDQLMEIDGTQSPEECLKRITRAIFS
jgi:adenylate kinase